MRKLTYLCFLFIVPFHACKFDKGATVDEKPQVTEASKAVFDKIISEPENKSKERFVAPKGWQEFTNTSKIQLDVRYATANNFVEEVLYPCGKCFLDQKAGIALNKVIDHLYDLGYKTVLFDCYRPRPIQQKLWDKVPNPSYVTPPKKGSMHNRGLAVDIGLADKDGVLLDMGSEYDFFGKEAHHDYMDHPPEILRRRQILNQIMALHGFKGIRTEWWHYSYQKSKMALSDWEWDCE